jgi:subtilisin family serine protease
MMNKVLISLVFFALLASPAMANEYLRSSNLSQIKVTNSLQDYANFGKGITIAVVDTGLNANHVELAGRVSAQSTCVATGNCALGFRDTHFHGTFVASIAAGSLNNTANTGMVGVAPQSTIMGIKIAQPSSSAFTTDINNGLLTAANRGAHVINLSYGSFFAPSTTSSFATLNRSLVNTLNSVATKNSVTVIAGGNSNKTFMDNVNQAGFSDASLSRLLFVGSVDKNNKISSFSNTPGSTKFISTTNKTVSLNSLWLVAPGEQLMGAHFASNTGYAYASGTSFSAPQVSGAVALLESRWPVLIRNGTAARVLLSTATDLGAKGVDDVYGVGLMNVERAFRPIGNLTVQNSNGQVVNLSQSSASLITSSAFGSLKALRSKVGVIRAFDSLGRDFETNIAASIQPAASSAPPPVVSAQSRQVVAQKVNFSEGGSLSYVTTKQSNFDQDKYDPSQKSIQDFSVSFTDQEGTTTAAGHGYSAALSFTDALWGEESNGVGDIKSLGLSNDLLSLAQGGGFLAYGEALNSKTRYAVSFSQTSTENDMTSSLSEEESSAKAIGIGFKRSLTPDINTSVTFNFLDEEHQLLGAKYSNSSLSFGDNHKSMSVGVTSSIDLGDDRNLAFDTAIARASGSQVQNSLIEDVSDIYATSAGVTYSQKHNFQKDDNFSVGLKQPLRVIKGSAMVASSGVDSDGNQVTSVDKVDLKSDGQELNLNFNYSAPLGDDGVISANLSANHDRDNIQGNHEANFMVTTKWSF